MADTSASRQSSVELLDQWPSEQLAASVVRRPGRPRSAADLDSNDVMMRGEARGAWRQQGLRLVFLALTLFALFGAVSQLYDLAREGSFAAADLLTVVFALLLAGALFVQLRGLVRLTPFARRLRRPRAAESGQTAILELSFLLNQAAAVSPSLEVARTRAGPGVLGRGVQRYLTVVADALAVISLIAILVYSAATGGLGTDLLLGGAFAGLAGFGYLRFLHALRQAGWRGTPAQIGRRAVYDSTRIYSGANIFVQTAITGTAAAASRQPDWRPWSSQGRQGSI